MKKIIALLLAVLMVASLAACASQASTAAEGKLTMATNAQFPPYEFYDGDTIVGIDAEIAGAIAEKLGLELVIEDMEFDSIIEAVKSGKADIGMAGMTVTPERQETVDFTATYATGKQVIIVTEDSTVTLDNLGEQMIGTQRGTTGNIYASDDYGDDHVTAYDNGATAVQALKNGQVNCVIIDNAPAQEYVKANPGLKILETEYVIEDYAIGVDKQNTQLLEAINGALAELTADGTIQGILDTYISAE